MHLHLPPLLEGLFSIAVFLGVVIIALKLIKRFLLEQLKNVGTNGNPAPGLLSALSLGLFWLNGFHYTTSYPLD